MRSRAWRPKSLPALTPDWLQHCGASMIWLMLVAGWVALGMRRYHSLVWPAYHGDCLGVTSPHLTSPHLTSPHLTSPHLTSPHLTSPHLTSPHLTSPHLTLPYLTFFLKLVGTV